MAYCDQSDLELAAGGVEALIQLCDQDDSGILDVAKMTKAINYGQSIVDGYIQNVSQVPVASPDNALKLHAALVSVYWLKVWARSVTPEDTQHYREVVLAYLEARGAGRIGASGDDPPTNSDRPDGAYERSSSHDVSRAKFRGVIW